jgi:hypothetical protein
MRDVLDDPGRAEEIEDESLEDYAMRRKIQIVNPTRGVKAMPRQTESREELRERIREALEYPSNILKQLVSSKVTLRISLKARASVGETSRYRSKPRSRAKK